MRETRFLRNILFTALLGALLAMSAGCAQINEALLSMSPKAEIRGMGLSDLDLQGATINVEVEVKNPGSVSIPLVDMDYRLTSGGRPFIDGKMPLDGTIPGKGSRTFSVPVRVGFTEVMSILKDFRLGSVVPYEVEMGLALNTPVQPTRLPLRREGKFPIPAIPKFRLSELKWDRLDLLGARGVATIEIENTNEFAMELFQMDYVLKLAGTEVASSKLGKKLKLGASGGKGTLEIPLSVSPGAVGIAAFRALTGEKVDYSLRGGLGVDTPFGPLSMPLRSSGRTEEEEKEEEKPEGGLITIYKKLR